ncbi:MAG: YbjP/YqhG family protein [Tannerella sp.]|jgi:hypothetical protein|nr:YbjP/YqhG family protein [Tannerella sp.]
MKAKKTNSLLLVLLLFAILSCGQNHKTNTNEVRIESLNNKVIKTSEDEEAVNTLKEFYTAYISVFSLGINQKAEDSILNKYVAKELLIKIEKASMDYVSFIKAQDAKPEWIETLKITSVVEEKGIYKVCYTDSYNEKSSEVCIELLLTKKDDYYIINDILDQDLSEGQNKWDIATETDIESASSEELGDLNMTKWSNDCNSDNSVYFSVAVGQFRFSTNYTMNTELKKINATTFAVYFSYPIVRPIPEDMQDCRNYAENIPVAKIERIDDGLLEFTWLGFYDVEKKARVHTQNPFNTSLQSVILGKCNE